LIEIEIHLERKYFLAFWKDFIFFYIFEKAFTEIEIEIEFKKKMIFLVF